ncbi:MAG TPA: cellulase family glycosylhydrolase [Candidatus Sulfotelmatobacter sp.]|nr:cellulase family glycosylhydrolase [Candidatus Sulfotelmatobacter sp.]
MSSSSGAFSISIKGNTFVDGSGNVIQLRGVNLSGMEFVAIQGWDPSDPTGGQFGQANNPKWSAINAWKANVVRIPLNEDSWLALTCTDTSGVVHNADPGNNYKQALASLVSEANAAGLYVILDLHWAAPGNACPMLQSQMADADHSIDFWTSIADTYKNNPAVMFELFNEPFFDFDFSGDAWEYMMFGQNGSFSGYPATSNSGNWQNVMTSWNVASYQAMINAIRGTGASNVVLIGSVGYTSDLSGWLAHEPADPLHQMAATWHAYPTYGQAWENPCTGTDTYCTPGYSPQIFTEVQAILQAGVPVLTTETGDQDSTGTVGSPLVATVTTFADAPAEASTSTEPGATWPAVPSGLPQIGVLGWTWDVWTGANDILILDVNGTPTPGYGQFFQSWLVNHP